MLERFPWCEMMELVVVKKGEVVMSEGECVKVNVRLVRREVTRARGLGRLLSHLRMYFQHAESDLARLMVYHILKF